MAEVGAVLNSHVLGTRLRVKDLPVWLFGMFFVLLAIFSIFALIFLVPFFIDPAWSTLQADFDPNATTCRTVR